MKTTVHIVSSALALLTIATFWTATVVSELSQATPTITAVKSAIPWGLLVLVPSLAASRFSGLALARGVRTGTIGTKLRRMNVIGVLGLLVLAPSAFFLAFKAGYNQFDITFYLVQSAELVAGAVNLTLLGLNMRDGFRLTGRLNRSRAASDLGLIRSETVADGTTAFLFSKPSGFTHVAGQSAIFTLIDPPQTDAEGRSRTFTIASAPSEPDLMIAVRVRDTAFKRTLKTMMPGVSIRVSGVGGNLTLHHDATRPAVFIAGGIGITPFRSMILEATHRGLTHPMMLFYSNRRLQDAPFADELRALERGNPRFRMVLTLTANAASDGTWKGETGPIDGAMLRRYLTDITTPIYYLGPPPLVAAMQVMLKAIDVAAKNVRFEEFSGYPSPLDISARRSA